MITLFYNDKNEVELTYFVEVLDELKDRPCMEVAEEPVPEQREGKIPKLMCDGQKVWYEYEDRPLTELEELEEKMKTRQDEAIAELTMMIAQLGGAN